MEATVIFVVLAILLLVGVPIAICLGLSAGIYLLLFFQVPEWTTTTAVFAGILPNKFSATMEHFTLMAIPFFILSSNFLSTGGVARRIAVCQCPGGLVGWRPGNGRYHGLYPLCSGFRVEPGHGCSYWVHHDPGYA